MAHWWNFYGGAVKSLLVLVMALPVVSCTGGDGGPAGGGGSAVLNWTAPTQRADNTSLALSEIAGYRIYYGLEAGEYLGLVEINDPTATRVSISNIPPGTYYVVMTTLDTDGRESLWSSPELRVSF